MSPTDSQHCDSNTCHSPNDTYVRARHTCYIHKAHRTQALHLVSLIGSSNLKSIIGKPRRSSTGLSKPRANTSLVQGSLNPRFTLGKPFLLLNSISTGTQGTQGLPLTIISIPNFYLCRNTSLSKTQDPPLVRMPTKPKASPWSAHSQQLQRPKSKVQAPQVKTTYPRLVGKTFNQGQAKYVPHNHQRRNSIGQDNLSPDLLTRHSIRCKSQYLLTSIRGEVPQSERKHHHMSDKTFNQVEIKPEMISCYLLFNFRRPPRFYLHITKVFLPTLSKILHLSS